MNPPKLETVVALINPMTNRPFYLFVTPALLKQEAIKMFQEAEWSNPRPWLWHIKAIKTFGYLPDVVALETAGLDKIRARHDEAFSELNRRLAEERPVVNPEPLPDRMVICLADGSETIIDARMNEAITAHQWGTDAMGYVRHLCAERNRACDLGTISLHRFVAQCGPNHLTWHMDEDRSNNSRANLIRVMKTPNESQVSAVWSAIDELSSERGHRRGRPKQIVRYWETEP